MLPPVNNVDRLLLICLRLIPKTLLSRITGLLARITFPYPINLLMVRSYAALFKVDLSEAELPAARYHSLNAFFTRKLKIYARPIDTDRLAVLSPVDGRVMEVSPVVNGQLFQAKDWHYTLLDLLKDRSKAHLFTKGTFCTLYLSPSDYHRIHLPLDGAVTSLQYVPGYLYPVNRFSLNRIRNLFVINERLIVYLETDQGSVAMVMVGATNVGKIRLYFDEIRMNLFRRGPFQRTYKPKIKLNRGEELGCFEMGSTVILLFEKDRVELSINKGDTVRVGKAIGKLNLP